MIDTTNERGKPRVMIDGQALREFRIKRGITQEKLAALANVTRRTIQRAEAGSAVSLETLNFISDALAVHPDDLRKIDEGAEFDAAGVEPPTNGSPKAEFATAPPPSENEQKLGVQPQASDEGFNGGKIAGAVLIAAVLYMIDSSLANGYVRTVKSGEWLESAKVSFESSRSYNGTTAPFSMSKYHTCVDRRMQISLGNGIIYILRQDALNRFGGTVARNCGREQAGL